MSERRSRDEKFLDRLAEIVEEAAVGDAEETALLDFLDRINEAPYMVTSTFGLGRTGAVRRYA